jgi:hypothetical protein
MEEGLEAVADKIRECTDGRRSKVAADGTGAVLVKRRSIRVPS